ncbi:MAG: hypothetical protein U5L01_11705 [Rheinheimera sp.]|nr:hypothetical protein [Rheinheimera sp.]
MQPSNGIAEAQAFRDGATTILVVPQQNYDVTVIGPVNPKNSQSTCCGSAIVLLSIPSIALSFVTKLGAIQFWLFGVN